MQFIDLGKQFDQLEARIRANIDKVLAHKKFINGPEVQELEQQLREFVGVKHVLCCANGTDALTIPLMAWGLEPTDAVFVPSFTFFASAEAISVAGGTPVFVDCDPVTFNMDPEKLEAAIRRILEEGVLKPRGIIAVDLFGLPADYARIEPIAAKYGLFLVEDGAQSFGASMGGRLSGSFGGVATTSFFPAKPLGCYGDGGAIFTNDDELAARIRSIHVHGQGSDKYDNVRIGLNSRLDTIQAAILLAKLTVFPGELDARDKVAARYTAGLRGVVGTPEIPQGCRSAWAQYTVKVEPEKRQNFLSALKDAGIPTAVYYPVPIHQSTAYKGLAPASTDLVVSERLSSEVFSLPMHPYLSDEEIDRIVEVIEGVAK